MIPGGGGQDTASCVPMTCMAGETEGYVGTRRHAVGVMVGLSLLLGEAASVGAVPIDDAYMAGYAAAVLEREFRVTAPSLFVRDGVMTLPASELGGADQGAVTAALSRIRGVRRVIVLTAPASMTATTGASAPAATGTTTTPAAAAPAPARSTGQAYPPVEGTPTFEVLPAGLLFRPLIADPRWPAFGTVGRHYLDDSKWESIAAVELGDMMPLVRGRIGETWQWEAGVHAGLWALFDMDSDSANLTNLDYIVGGFGSVRQGPWSGIARVFHRSTHLGDEEIIHHHTNRINFSYEGMDARISYEPWDWMRLYGGGGYILRVEPSNYAPWKVHSGLELRSRWTMPGRLRPIFGADFQFLEEHDWQAQISLRGGLELESLAVLGRKVQLLIEYFNGHSVDGQFYTREVEYLGVGVRFKF
jgi:hypothetical protein